MRKTGVVLFSALLFVGSAIAADLKPLTPQDAAKVQELLRSFDPHSYEIHFRVQDPRLGARPFQAGLANLRQSNTVRPQTLARTGQINVYRPPLIVFVINIFAQTAQVRATTANQKASPTTDPMMAAIGGRPDLQMKAQQLNSLLAKYYVP
jgi:hypothetical protein